MELLLKQGVINGVKALYNEDLNEKQVQIQATRKDFEGDFTINVFPFLKQLKRKPEEVAQNLGEYLSKNVKHVGSFNVIKGFLNICISQSYWLESLKDLDKEVEKKSEKIVVEFSSPNTNKPLHLGHVRNNLLGESISRILLSTGYSVKKVNLLNDRGIHICKSMLAWQKWGKGVKPETSGMKGDKLVGDHYVMFDKEYKKQQNKLIEEGKSNDEAVDQAELIGEAREMLKKWEQGDNEVVEIWKMMNDWVYKGFEDTYKRLDISFDKLYFESDTYKLGKNIVLKGLNDGVLVKKEDGSVWADLTSEGLDEKILLRADGTSVYMTQDIGTAELRYSDYSPDKMVYVVGNEQIYHFNVLKIVMNKLGYEWSDRIEHFPYGMVELPEGKMKTREGTVVDADDLMDEMIRTAKQMSDELGKLDGFSDEEKKDIYRIIGLGALKYFILKVDPKKNMVFNPQESIDFNGNTGPFIQYTYARINSLLNKASDRKVEIQYSDLNEKEIELIKTLNQFRQVKEDAASRMSPALIANYTYELVKEYNQFYHDYAILKEKESVRDFRLLLSEKVGKTIKEAMYLLGIEVPVRM